MRLLLAILLVSSVHFGAHLYMPALPAMAAHYELSPVDMVQVIMLYFFGFGLSHLFYGPWIEAVGPRKVFFSGLSLFTLGSVLCYFSTSIEALSVGRVLQGLGAGAPMILSRAVVTHTFSGEKLTKALSTLSVASAASLVATSIIGGWSSAMFGWQMSFMLLGLYLLIVMALGVLFLPFEIKPKSKMPFLSIADDYVKLLTSRHFICIGIFKWVPTLLFFCSITYLPFVMQQRFDYNEVQYGLYMMWPFCAAMLGGILSGILSKRYSSRAVIAIFWPLMVAACALLLSQPDSDVAAIAAVSLFMIVKGAYYPSTLHLVMQRFKFKGETANNLLWAVDMLLISIGATLVNRYLLTDLQDLGGVFTLGTLLILINWLILHHAMAWKSAEKRLMNVINN